MATPTGRLTRGTIIQQAQRLVGNTNTALKSELRTALNMLLADTHAQWDWPFLFTSTTLTLTSATFTLPTNFLKAQDPWGLVVTAVAGVVMNLRVQEVDEEVFTANAAPGTTGAHPLFWYADHSAGVGRIWPTPDDTVSASLRYKLWTADADESDTTTYDADVPVFPHSSYLVARIAALVATWDKDFATSDRMDARADNILQLALGTAFPNKALALGALDSDVFGPSFIPEDT
jgi:hypothetical protein